MAEEIVQIARSIKRHRQQELKGSFSNPAFGRCLATFNNKHGPFWLTNKENITGQDLYDLNRNIVARSIGKQTTLTTDGLAVYKNTKIGEVLILNHEGSHKVNVPAGEFMLKLYNRATYIPDNSNFEYARDILIKLSGDNKTHSFKDISKILTLQKEIDGEKEKLENVTNKEAEKLIQRIESKEAEMKAYLDKAQGFIRKYAELRYQPILDPLQESIKRSKIFDGTLIINGGPGTGKTTSLIQRIKFLISKSIGEYIALDENQKDILFDQKTSWIFYSPNELLALFLRNSMKMEELIGDTERVKVWSSHKNELVKAYKLVDTTGKGPFLIYTKSRGNSIFVNEAKNIKEIVSDLTKFFIHIQEDKLNKISELDVSPFKWKRTGMSIQKYLENKKNIQSIDELIRLFINLSTTYKAESDKISDEYSELIKQVAGKIQVVISKDIERTALLSEILYNWKNSSQDADENEEEDDSEIDLEVFEEKVELADFDFERELFMRLKTICRKQSLKKFDKNIKFSKRDHELIKLIPEVGQQNEFEEIGQAAYFKKFFERITKGVLPNILREIPITYKRHRRNQLASKNPNWDLQLLGELVLKDKNSRIHSDEQALLLNFINGICFNLSKGFRRQFNSINHPYLTSYKNHCKPVIGIDEATDFSIIDLLAINSFRHPEFSSVTLSGDIMQRMTNDGLTDWENFSSIVSGTERMDLEVSYRQSPTLLTLAQAIYEKSTGNKASYKSFIEQDESEPKPLMFVSDDEDIKLEWIASRIIEIQKAYGDSIPSIAIFLPNESLLEEFATKLGNLETLLDVGILVKACRNGDVLGDQNTVRIFSIDKIKGLEFEAVFFHNLDEIQNQNLSGDLLLKYLYVGLSRATFYLGLTVNEDFSEDLDFISKNFDRTGKSWSH